MIGTVAVIVGLALAAPAEDAAGMVTHGDWAVQCAEKTCQGYLSVAKKNGSAPLATLSFHHYQSGNDPEILLTTPLGTALEPGARLMIDDDAYVTLRARSCFPDGCRYAASMPPGIMQRLRTTDALRVSFFGYANGERVEYPISANGLSDMLEALDARND